MRPQCLALSTSDLGGFWLIRDFDLKKPFWYVLGGMLVKDRF